MVGVYSHVLGSWKTYPRANLCQEQFKSVYKRFKAVAAKWPPSSTIIKSELTEELDKKTCKLDNDITIIVIGRDDIDVKKLVVSADVLKGKYSQDSPLLPKKGRSESESKPQQYTVVICYEKIKGFTSKGLQGVQNCLKQLKSLEGNLGPTMLGSPLIVCETDTSKNVGSVKYQQFLEDIKLTAQKILGTSLEDENIIICGKEKSAIGRRISDIFERDIIEGVHELRMHLGEFIGDKSFDTSQFDVIESEQLVASMQGFLKNGLGFVDILESNNDKLPFIEVTLINLMKVIRCAVMTPLANKNGITPDECNEIAHNYEFDDKMIKSVSKNARYHLANMEQPCRDMVIATKAGNKHHQFPGKHFVFIAYVVREDIKKEFKKFEEILNTSRRAAISLTKMLFEIDGYLYSSKMTQGFDLKPKQTEIPRALKEAVLGIEGVFGIGTIYGRIVVHLEKLMNEKAMEVEELVSETMRSFKFSNPYKVVSIVQKSTCFCLETGKSIGCECPTDTFIKGTLGGFAIDDKTEMYALTCAHVVHAEHQAEHNVYNENMHVFGCSGPGTTIPPTKESLIDIAAVKVTENKYKKQCKPNLKDEEGRYDNRTSLFMGTAQDLINDNRRVFKHGAGSDLTEGIVCCSDYSKLKNEIRDELVLIETVPGLDEKYAKKGDSGSINCISSISPDHIPTVEAVSMLCAGNLLVQDGDEYCESFFLREGINRLNSTGNLNLRFPATA